MPEWSRKNDEGEPDNGGQAAQNAGATGRKAGSSGSYDSWTVPELRRRAKELGMTGYSALSKSDLIFELRSR